ncbi:lactate racemase domain-containing protein [Thalassoglobus polymorphus]|uniref:LarA-like N-terminal domain-containing protein n=1 Tax=Thalassoglobus polymorphus TaxID=2527994 RepID=A0A517QRW5_9PLAN|nr:lactate racemase domain-containing protein [Thalassoglobus polymorphus]QDT34339.1 hypothetical protein Mal48_35990 [Thalassoglobus polymorphus]
MSFPRMLRIRQQFERPRIEDVAQEATYQLSQLNLASQIQDGQTVAITVGSRGIANIATMTKAVVEHIKSLGGIPFIVPAMGSHGGATAEGQKKLIEGFGVTEDFLGCEIRSSMETIIVAETSQGIPVHFDKNAYAADHLIIMGRIKPHTGFVGDIESGLHKMMLIGLGKHAGALMYHRAIKNFSFGEIIRSVAEIVLDKCKVLAGVAIVENAYDETALIEAIPPGQFYDREKELLKQATAWMPKLPFPEADLLIIDRIGKNISGTGMDTNIVGRKYNDHVATEKDNANVKRIFVRSLTEETKGNATGIGIAEFVLQSCVDQINTESTRINCITSSHPTGAMIPCVYQNDRDAITDALQTIGLTEPEDAKVMHIQDTLHLAELEISEAYLKDKTDHSFEILSGPYEFEMNSGAIKNI